MADLVNRLLANKPPATIKAIETAATNTETPAAAAQRQKERGNRVRRMLNKEQKRAEEVKLAEVAKRLAERNAANATANAQARNGGRRRKSRKSRKSTSRRRTFRK
jgi:ATP sulfurylase